MYRCTGRPQVAYVGHGASVWHRHASVWPGARHLRLVPTATSSSNRAAQFGQQQQPQIEQDGDSAATSSTQLPDPGGDRSTSSDSLASYRSVDDTSDNDVYPGMSTSTPSPGAASPPVQLRMPHPTSINTSRERHWALVQDLVPRQEWQKIAVVLACVEAIHRSEFLQYGQAAVAALQAANAALVPSEPEGPARKTGRRRSSSSLSDDESYSRSPSLSPSASSSPRSKSPSVSSIQGQARPSGWADAAEPGSPDSSQAQSEQQDDTAGQQLGWDSSSLSSASSWTEGGSELDTSASTEPLQVPEPETLAETAARLDLELASLVTLLARRSSFQPLSRRDVEVSKVLNKDYLSQLFIVGDLRRMDRSLVKAMVQAGLLSRRAVNKEGSGGTPSAGAAEVADVLSEKPSPGSFDWAEPLPSSKSSSRSPSAGAQEEDPWNAALTQARRNRSNGHHTHQNEHQPDDQQPPGSLEQQPKDAQGHAQESDHMAASESALHSGSRAAEQALHSSNTRNHSTSPSPRPATFDVNKDSSSSADTGQASTRARTKSPSLLSAGLIGASAGRAGSLKASSFGGASPSMARPAFDLDRVKIQSPSPAALLGLMPEEVQQVVEELGAARYGNAPDAEGPLRPFAPGELLAPESAGLVLLKRSWGEEESTGRLMVQKLDYLQTQAVTWVLDYIRSATVTSAVSIMTGLSRAAEEVRRANAGLYEEATGRSLMSETHEAGSDTQLEHTRSSPNKSQPESEPELSQEQRPMLETGYGMSMFKVPNALENRKQEFLRSSKRPVGSSGSWQEDELQSGHSIPLSNDVQGSQETDTDTWVHVTRSNGRLRYLESEGSPPAGLPDDVFGSRETDGDSSEQGSEQGTSSRAAGGGGLHRGSFSRSASPSVEDSGPASAGVWWEAVRSSLVSAGSAADLGTKVAAAGRAWAQWFSDRGVGPRLDVMPLPDIDDMLPVVEPNRLTPLTLRKVALAEVLGTQPFSQSLGNLVALIIQPVKLQQPTFKEFVVVYRRMPDLHRGPPGWVQVLQQAGRRLKLLPTPPTSPPKPRQPIQIRIYRDLPVPTWQLALPDKLLQFRPLDLLRSDLFALIGLVALLAQARYDSLLLDILTFISATVFIVRIALGFKRMDDRYRNQVAEVLREKTVASNAAALEFLAAAAALQQFKQASLAYVYALQHQQPQEDSSPASEVAGVAQAAAAREQEPAAHAARDGHDVQPTWGVPCEQLAGAIETLLQERCGQQVLFDAEEAVGELVRLGLAQTRPLGSSEGSGAAPDDEGGDASHGQLQYRVVGPSEAMRLVQQHWDGLLWQRVDGILREFE